MRFATDEVAFVGGFGGVAADRLARRPRADRRSHRNRQSDLQGGGPPRAHVLDPGDPGRLTRLGTSAATERCRWERWRWSGSFRGGPRERGAGADLGVEPAVPVVVPGSLDPAALLPVRRTSWRYQGSLTTPPCTEGVAWVVLAEPLTLSAAQIDAFGAIYPNNRRPVQPLGERVPWRG